MMLGRETKCPLDIMMGVPSQAPVEICPQIYVEWLKKAMSKAFQHAHDYLGKAAARQVQNYDYGLKPRKYSLGDFVWRWYPPALTCKLGQGWSGPYKVTKVISEITYEVQRKPDTRLVSVHVDHLKPYEGVAIPHDWVEDKICLSDPESDLDTPGPTQEPMKTPVKTRAGRVVKPKKIFSP